MALEQHRSPAHRRLAFDELFLLHLGLALRRQGVKHEPGIAFHVDGERLARARGLLPFTLTRAQARTVAEIGRDMARPEPMHRLLQGDVGSGKTAVAAVAAALAVEDGWQVALMAPTEILAAQHHATFSRIFEPAAVEVSLVTGSGTGSGKRRAREAVESGRARIAVGTQALIQEGIAFQRLGLVLIDEQHRFGVLQRQALGHKGRRPDVLVMTATPIPRTLAMTLYGDLDLSVLDELPPGRTPITTRVATPSRQPEVWEAVELELQKGRQAYVLYPLVEASEKIDLADATRGAEELQARWPHRRVRLLHGRLKQEEKDAVMQAFRSGAGRRAGLHHGGRGRRRRGERLGDGHPARGAVRAVAAAPAAGPGGAGGGGFVLLPACRPRRGGRTPGPGWRCWSRAPTASSSPRRTSSCAARGSSWGRGRAAFRS